MYIATISMSADNVSPHFAGVSSTTPVVDLADTQGLKWAVDGSSSRYSEGGNAPTDAPALWALTSIKRRRVDVPADQISQVDNQEKMPVGVITGVGQLDSSNIVVEGLFRSDLLLGCTESSSDSEDAAAGTLQASTSSPASAPSFVADTPESTPVAARGEMEEDGHDDPTSSTPLEERLKVIEASRRPLPASECLLFLPRFQDAKCVRACLELPYQDFSVRLCQHVSVRRLMGAAAASDSPGSSETAALGIAAAMVIAAERNIRRNQHMGECSSHLKMMDV